MAGNYWEGNGTNRRFVFYKNLYKEETQIFKVEKKERRKKVIITRKEMMN